MSKKEWKMGQIFVAFSEYRNFIKNFTMRRATILQWVIISVAKEVLTRAYLSTYQQTEINNFQGYFVTKANSTITSFVVRV